VPAGAEEDERDLMLDLYATRVRRYIRTYYAGRAQSCFDRAARVNDGLRGTVLVTFTIKEAGGTEGVRVTRNTTGDDVLANCLVNQVREWDLPGPPGGALELSMPFSR
jgi:TonB family protein